MKDNTQDIILALVVFMMVLPIFFDREYHLIGGGIIRSECINPFYQSSSRLQKYVKKQS